MELPVIDLAPLSASRALNRAPMQLGPGVARVAAQDDAADVYIYGDIGGWWDGIQPGEFAKEIAALDVSTLNVRINSPGGIVFDGVAIYNSLVQHKASVIIHIEGVAASIASVIAMAGDEIRIGEAAHLMIHKPWSFVVGDAELMRKEAEVLDGLEQGLIDIYVARTGNDEDQIRNWLAAETWFRGQQAVDNSFADVVIPAKSKEKKAARSALLSLYEHTPKDLIPERRDCPEVREFERLLRDAEQQPNAFAKRVAALAAKVFSNGRDGRSADPRDEDGPAEAAAPLLRLAAHIRTLISK